MSEKSDSVVRVFLYSAFLTTVTPQLGFSSLNFSSLDNIRVLLLKIPCSDNFALHVGALSLLCFASLYFCDEWLRRVGHSSRCRAFCFDFVGWLLIVLQACQRNVKWFSVLGVVGVACVSMNLILP